MRDERRQEIQWGKMYPKLMLCKARYRQEPVGQEIPEVDITFPDGEIVGSDSPGVHDKLSELIGREATLQKIQPPENLEFYRRYKPNEEQFVEEVEQAFAREPGEPIPDLRQFPEILMDYVAVPGTFFDNEELNLVTTATIRFMESKNATANWDIRRFRPNFFVETIEGQEGLVEQNWVGKTLKIGGAVITVAAPTPRCGMTVRPQDDLEYDKSILRTVVKEADQNLGVGAHCEQPGQIRVGDPVEIIA
jgi:hypothetical protein